MTDEDRNELASLRKRVEMLSDVMEEIAMIADGHRKSTLRYASGNNVALSVILGRAASAIGREERLRETGTIFAPLGTVVR
jgi:hypothetical protein